MFPQLVRQIGVLGKQFLLRKRLPASPAVPEIVQNLTDPEVMSI
jgi:hypothetical protein